MPNEEREDIVILSDDEGNEVEFLFLDAFEVSGRKYAVLVPLEESEQGEETAEDPDEVVEGSEAMIFRLDKDEDGDEVFAEIEDDEEWAQVTAAWEELQDEDFEDEDFDDDADADEEDDDDDDEPEETQPSGGWAL